MMFRVHWVLAGLLILPIAELAVFFAIASEIGVLAALILMLATSLAGAAVIGGAGRGARARFRAAAGADTPEAGIPGAFTVIAGILLLVPGFLTDIRHPAAHPGPAATHSREAVAQFRRRAEERGPGRRARPGRMAAGRRGGRQ